MEATLRRSSSVGGLFYPRRFLTAARPVGWRVDAHVKERGGRNPTELSRRSAPKPGLGGAVPAEPTSWSTCGTVIPMEPAENVSGPAGRGVLRQSGLEWKPKHMKFELLYPL